MRKEVYCPNCGSANSAKIKGDGFLTLPCSECRYPIRDMDNYFDVVYGGQHIPCAKEKAKYMIVGVLICIALFLCYSVWVTTAMHYLGYYPLHHSLEFVKMMLIFFGAPFLLYKRVDKFLQ